jgi:hypothetical protein
MKQSIFYILFLVSILFLSCSSNPDKGKTGGEKMDEAQVNTNSQQDIPQSTSEVFPTEKANFYAHYRGTINNNIPIHLNLVRTGDKISGYYYYDKFQIPIKLSSGKLDEATGKFSFIEYTPTQERSGSVVAQFQGKKISGNWMDADSSQQFPLELVQSMDAYSLPMDVFHEEDISALLKGKTETPTITFIRTVLMPNSNYGGSEKEQIYKIFEAFLGDDTSVISGNPYATIEKMKEISVKDYRETNIELYEEEPDMFGTSMNWSEVAHILPMYNDNDLLSIRQEWYSYTGGAHGNFGASNYAINLKTGKEIKLNDLFLEQNQSQLSDIIEQKILEQQHKFIGEQASLQDAGFFVEEINPTENFYLTKKGIGFYYSPYEIAPYAAGAIEVFVPFSDCKHLMKKDFL